MKLSVPATTANLGPGFDVFGLALKLYLTVVVKESPGAPQLIYRGRDATSVPTDETNLLCRAIQHVAERHRVRLPDLTLDVHNEIPIGRGLGSSGAAVVAGVLIANTVGQLALSRHQLLDYALQIEPHPDNITAAMFGGLVACCVTEQGESLHTKIPISPRIKAVIVVPDFALATTQARSVLPPQYSRADAVFNLQRVALLAATLGTAEPTLIAEAMQDRLHQPYRQALIPGLEESLQLRGVPGLLGVSLSGAGPSLLALAEQNFGAIGELLQSNFRRHGIESEVLILDIEERGACFIEP
ncbi:MAG: homoserine kinase [Acidobacteriota bacterium]|nr:homoserine kinase [Blastocatellia bacterium]MDW8241214.1 homoserine kinase [Acidobacteriota bacterium]